MRRGSHHTLEAIRKISVSNMGKPSPLRGRLLTEEHRKAISDRMKGNKHALGRKIIGRKSPPPFSDEHRKKMSVASFGKKKSFEARLKMHRVHLGVLLSDEHRMAKQAACSTPEFRQATRERTQKHIALDFPNCRCWPHQSRNGLLRNGSTNIEVLLVNILLAEFPEVREQEQFGCYQVDAYLPPPYHLAFEADGTYWHRYPKRDAARDAYLLRKFNLPVVRLTEKELRENCMVEKWNR